MSSFENENTGTAPAKPVERPIERESFGRLWEMLSYRRPHRSASEKHFIRRFVAPLGVKSDSYGNRYLRIGDAPVMWSSHTDSVHRRAGRQRLAFNGKTGRIKLSQAERKRECLGADCATGVWIMGEMIRRNVPGLYVFHRGEESGGLGSRWLVKNNAKLVEGITMAIAFDRKGIDSVITHQGHRTASDAFATALGTAIGLGYKPDSTGLFTDTAVYTGLIPECTNLSVGYSGAHSSDESQCPLHAWRLLESIAALDVSKLPIVRSVNDPDETAFSRYYGAQPGWDTWEDYRDFDSRYLPGRWTNATPRKKVYNLPKRYLPEGPSADPSPAPRYRGGKSNRADLERYIRDNADAVADYLDGEGIGVDDLQSWTGLNF